MLHDYLRNAPYAASLNISENFSSAKIKLPPLRQDMIMELIQNIGQIPTRDTFELILDAGEDQSTITNLTISEAASTLQAFSLEADDEIFSVLTIRKEIVDRQVSIYFFEDFVSFLQVATLQNFLKAFKPYSESPLHFHVLDPISSFESDYFSFSNSVASTKIVSSSRRERLTSFRDHTNVVGLELGFLPSDFFLVERSSNEHINRLFDKASAVLSLAFLANTAELKETTFSFKLYGYKAIVCSDLALDSLISEAPILKQIYSWTYDGGNVTDKLGLVRNVFSIHMDEVGTVKLNSSVWDAIRSNYQIYLKGNIQSYLEIKSKLSELLFESISKTSKLAEDVFDSLKNNVFIVLTFLLTVVVINGLKDTSFSSIFSTPYLLITGFLSLCSLLWMFFIRKDTILRYQSAADSMSGVLHRNYDKFLMTSEIEASLAPTLKSNQEFLERQIGKYCTWWAIMTGLFFTLFLVGNLLFVQIASNSESKNSAPAANQTAPEIEAHQAPKENVNTPSPSSKKAKKNSRALPEAQPRKSSSP